MRRHRGHRAGRARSALVTGVASALLATGCAGTPSPPLSNPSNRSLIVTCDCPTPGERERIAEAVARHGGRVLYVYRETPGLAVMAPAGTEPEAFRRWLARQPKVIDVQPNGSVGLHTPQ